MLGSVNQDLANMMSGIEPNCHDRKMTVKEQGFIDRDQLSYGWSAVSDNREKVKNRRSLIDSTNLFV